MRRAGPPADLSWQTLLAKWELIEADLHERYGIDVESGILRRRTWRWLQIRILGLLSTESRVQRHFIPAEEPHTTTRRR